MDGLPGEMVKEERKPGRVPYQPKFLPHLILQGRIVVGVIPLTLSQLEAGNLGFILSYQFYGRSPWVAQTPRQFQKVQAS